MELVITKQAMISSRECTNYVVPDELWVKFKFECCYPDGKCSIGKAGETKAQLSMQNDTVTLKESGKYEVCLLGRNTKSSLYAELIQTGGGQGQTVVVAAGDNVTVDKSQSDNTVTYTVNAKDDDSKTVLQAGENISVTSSKSGDTTTWTISGEAGGSNTEVRAGQNITVTSSSEGDKTVYTVNATEQESHTQVVAGANVTVNKSESGGITTYTISSPDQTSHTIVRAGENVTVVESTEGNKTVYTVSSSGSSAPPKTYKITSADTDTLTVQENTVGDTTTFTLTATGGGDADVEINSTDPNLIIVKR